MVKIFIIVELVLKALRLWDLFLDYLDAKYDQELLTRRQAREKAIEDLKNCKTEQECDDASDNLHNIDRSI